VGDYVTHGDGGRGWQWSGSATLKAAFVAAEGARSSRGMVVYVEESTGLLCVRVLAGSKSR